MTDKGQETSDNKCTGKCPKGMETANIELDENYTTPNITYGQFEIIIVFVWRYYQLYTCILSATFADAMNCKSTHPTIQNGIFKVTCWAYFILLSDFLKVHCG